MMAQEPTCRECGAKLGPDVAEGICPACALRAALLPAPNERLVPDPTLPAETTIHYFGDYELLAEIGRGGMGVVYRARQTKLNRPVALKLILAGRLASEADVKRFQQEAQAAANLQHPNIVAVHEVGRHEGQHYYSMDLVGGRSLAELVRPQPLPAREAARYLKTVADAVHYAHQHGTLHRDLKPTNILIDGRDEPRITDFGLARCEHFDSHLTTTGQLLGTPAFMSPEQAQAQPEALGPASDLYSLGAVLYYLLTQRPPFAAESLPALLDQVVHEEPVSPRALNPSVPRDLETICLKCLQKDPAHRFGSAQDISDELGRFCNGQPILSRPPGLAERTWRWCARNRAVAGSLAAVLVVLVAGTVVSTREAIRARAEAAKSQQIARFLQDMLKGVGPSVALGRDTKLLHEILNKTAGRIGRELKNQPEVEAALWSTVGNVYEQIGEYDRAEQALHAAIALKTASPGKEDAQLAALLGNLGTVLERKGSLAEAEILHRRALAIQERVLGPANPEVAQSLSHIGNVLFRQGKFAEAEPYYRKSLELSRKVDGPRSLSVAMALGNLGNLLGRRNQLEESEKMFREALGLQKELLGPDDPTVAKTLSNLGITLDALGNTAEAEECLRESVALRRKILPPDHPDLAFSLNNLGATLQHRGKYAEAELAHREALAIRRRRLSNEHPDVAFSLNNLAEALQAQDKLVEAETAYREAVAIRRKAPGLDPAYLVQSLVGLGGTLVAERKLTAAQDVYDESLAILKELPGDRDKDVAAVEKDLALVLTAEDNLTEAESLQREELALRRKLLQKQSPPLPASVSGFADACSRLTRTLIAESKFSEAESLAREGLAFGEKHLPDDWQTFNARSLLGASLAGQKKFADAEPLLLSGYEGLKQREHSIPDEHKSRLSEVIQRIVRLYEATGRPELAKQWREKMQPAKEKAK